MPNPVLVTFVLTAALVFGAYWLFVAREEVAEQSALRRRLRGGGVKKVGGGPASASSLVRIDPPYSDIPAFDSLLNRVGFISSRTQLLIDRAGLNITVGVLVAACLAVAVAAFGLV